MAYHPFRHLGLKVLAIALATLLWLTVAGQHVVERTLRVPLENINMPPGLEIVGDVPAAVDVRLRGSSAILSGDSRTVWPIATFAGSASTRTENTRRPSTLTIAKTRGPAKPAGSPTSWTVNAWIVPSPDRSTHSKRSDRHSPQNARGGQARRLQSAHRVVASRPAASRA